MIREATEVAVIVCFEAYKWNSLPGYNFIFSPSKRIIKELKYILYNNLPDQALVWGIKKEDSENLPIKREPGFSKSGIWNRELTIAGQKKWCEYTEELHHSFSFSAFAASWLIHELLVRSFRTVQQYLHFEKMAHLPTTTEVLIKAITIFNGHRGLQTYWITSCIFFFIWNELQRSWPTCHRTLTFCERAANLST